MKTGNEILDKALQAQKGIGEIEIVKSLFYENPISYGELTSPNYTVNYTHINFLLKDIESAYNKWNKAIGILEKTVDFSKDYYRQKLDGLKEQMYWLNDHGKQARGLDGMIKDMIIFKTGNYEASPGAQQRIYQVYERYNLKLKSTVEQIEKRFLDIIYGNKSKDTRPLVEKLKPIIDQLQPEQSELFINGLKNHVKPEINLIALEINILMQQPTNILQLYFSEPNDEEKRMIEELKSQLEQMNLKFEKQIQENNTLKIENIRVTEEKTQALEQVAERDMIIEEQKNKNLELTAKLEQKTAENEDLVLKLQASETKLIPLQEKIAELKAENKELKDDKTELREDKKILIEDKKILQEEKKIVLDEKKLLAEEKKYYFDLSKELTQKVSEKDIAITNLNLLVEQEHFKYDELHEKYVALLGEQ